MDNHSKKILITDDSRLSRMLISKIIAQHHPDWKIIEANSGHDAIEKANEEKPHYITMDYNMDGITGAEAVAQIQKFLPNTIIALFTANIQSSTREQADHLGIKFVGKPVTETSVQQALDYFASRT